MKAERDRFPAVAHVMLRRADQLYLLRRSHTGFMDGYYVLPGGHVSHGESVTQGAYRECLEEAGVRAELQPRCVLPYISGRHQGFNFVFEALNFQGEPYVAEPELFDAGGWYPIDGLPGRCAPWIAEVVGLAQDQWFRELRWQ